MTLPEVKAMLESINGFDDKVVYLAWPVGEAPALPFICYFTPNANTFGADNKVYYSANRFIVELYSQAKDVVTEDLIESKFSDNSVFYSKTTEYINDENCYLTTYEIEV